MKHLLIFLSIASGALAQTYLRADGVTDTYSLIKKVLGGDGYEVPDCIHNVKHISQAKDTALNKQVFLFSIHVTPDNDACTNNEKQRVEIKTMGASPDSIKGFKGDMVTLSWSFKLDASFKPSSTYTHIHQIKSGDGDPIGSPILTLTPRYKSSGNVVEINHVDSKGVRTKPAVVKLAPFLGKWVHVTEKLTYNYAGKYSISIKDMQSGASLLEYSSRNIDLWRAETTFVRPKWGIYRGLSDKGRLRDEVIRFADFCIGKGTAVCS